jgi:hypothetical protein
VTTPISYGPVDEAVKQWLTTATATNNTRVKAGSNIYLAMPKANPRPVLLIRLVGGAPGRRADLPLSKYRIQFDCIAASRTAAADLMLALIGDLEALARDGNGFVAAGMYLGAAEVLLMRWQPDPDSDVPRYIVDALITTVH